MRFLKGRRPGRAGAGGRRKVALKAPACYACSRENVFRVPERRRRLRRRKRRIGGGGDLAPFGRAHGRTAHKKSICWQMDGCSNAAPDGLASFIPPSGRWMDGSRSSSLLARCLARPSLPPYGMSHHHRHHRCRPNPIIVGGGGGGRSRGAK